MFVWGQKIARSKEMATLSPLTGLTPCQRLAPRLRASQVGASDGKPLYTTALGRVKARVQGGEPVVHPVVRLRWSCRRWMIGNKTWNVKPLNLVLLYVFILWAV